jgi:uncharacterized sulfatase
VFIMTDTQATNVLGCYDHPAAEALGDGARAIRRELRTPRIDQLAAGGIAFERAYTTCPLCTPARAALFTGRAAHAVGAWANNQPLGANVRHMGQRFRDAGYRTAYSGKWHLDGHDYFGTGICPDGWDDRYWYDGMRYQQELTPEQRSLWRGGLRTVEALERHGVGPGLLWAHRVADRAERFLREAAAEPERPFLFVASFDEPHGPFTCPPEYAAPFVDYRYPLGPAALDDLRDKPRFQRQWSEGRRTGGPTGHATHPLYFGCNSFVDSEIGRVIDAVDRHAPDDTWIVYTSDHGEMLGAHGLHGKAAAVYEEIAHIPLIIRGPRDRAGDQAGPGGMRPPGSRVRTLASHMDVLPTMLHLAGLPVPPVFEGESLVPLLRGAEDPERSVFIEFNRFAAQGDGTGGFHPMRAVVKGAHKLAVHLLDRDELYDRATDVAEVRNRIGDATLADVRDALHDEIIDWMYANRDPFRGQAWEERPWRQKPRRLTFAGGWEGRRHGRDDGYSPPFTQENARAAQAGRAARAAQQIAR